jgi:protein SCO1/2
LLARNHDDYPCIPLPDPEGGRSGLWKNGRRYSGFVKPRAWIAAGLAVLVLAGATAAFAYVRATRGSLPPITGDVLDRPVPAVPMLDQTGHPTTLADFRGKVVVLAPTLTLCSEVCPITSGAFIRMQRAVRRTGLAARVAFVEATVDPGRDTAGRLRAYERLTGVDWALLTGTPQQVKSFWSFFGVGYFKQPQGDPPSKDWLTGKPLTYDVAHSDGLFLIDGRGHERIAMVGPPTTGGRLAPQLKRLLDEHGLENISHPRGAWTVDQALNDLSNLLGTRITE